MTTSATPKKMKLVLKPSKVGGLQTRRSLPSPSGPVSRRGRVSPPHLHYVVLDTELKYEIPCLLNGSLDWDSARQGLCGMSVAVLYDSETQRFHLYDELTIDDLCDHLETADIVVSFNGDYFDIPIIQAISGRTLNIASYDILQAIWDVLPDKHVKGYKLADITPRTINLYKSNTGASAATLYADERFAELFDYCLNDVHLTNELWKYIMEFGCIIDVNGDPLYLETPYER